MSDEKDWINSRELVKLWYAGGSNTGPLEHKLRPGLRAGLVASKARFAEIERRTPHGRKASSDEADWLVPPDVWKGTGENSAFDIAQDYYSSRAPGIGFASVKLRQISFDREQVLAFADIKSENDAANLTPSLPSLPPSNPRGAGRNPDKLAWTRFAAAFAVISSEEVDLTEPGVSANSIHGKIDELVRRFTGGDALSIDNVRDAITLAQDWSQRSRG